ncbi:hypothetical protein BDV97DRAFT_221515 [Delphinella strobiligena]|nr:hypothetical protein BDV97DRAFT_221515 [Delphinella strobiligena]
MLRSCVALTPPFIYRSRFSHMTSAHQSTGRVWSVPLPGNADFCGLVLGWLLAGDWCLGLGTSSSSSDVACLPCFCMKIFSHCFIHLLSLPLCCDSSYSLPLQSLQRTRCDLHYLCVTDIQETMIGLGVNVHTSGVRSAQYVSMVILLALLYALRRSLMDEQYRHSTVYVEPMTNADEPVSTTSFTLCLGRTSMAIVSDRPHARVLVRLYGWVTFNSLTCVRRDIM